MKSLYEINGELDKFIELKNNRLFDFPPFRRITITTEEIIESIILLYEIRDVIKNNTIEVAENILNKQREDVIQKLENFSQNCATKYDYIICSNLTDKLICLNWVLDRTEFDKEIY